MIVPTASMTDPPGADERGSWSARRRRSGISSRIQEQIVNFVTANSSIKRQKFLEYMMQTDEIATDVGTVVYGREAVPTGSSTSSAACALVPVLCTGLSAVSARAAAARGKSDKARKVWKFLRFCAMIINTA